MPQVLNKWHFIFLCYRDLSELMSCLVIITADGHCRLLSTPKLSVFRELIWVKYLKHLFVCEYCEPEILKHSQVIIINFLCVGQGVTPWQTRSMWRATVKSDRTNPCFITATTATVPPTSHCQLTFLCMNWQGTLGQAPHERLDVFVWNVIVKSEMKWTNGEKEREREKETKEREWLIS